MLSKEGVVRSILSILMMLAALPAQAEHILSCQFKGVGEVQFARPDASSDFVSDDGYRWTTLETEQFIQLQSSHIDEKQVTNPFTVYMFDKKFNRIRRVSSGMRGAPMMADGRCVLATQ